MIRRSLADRLVEERGEDGYVYPAYGDYCFASVPGAVDDLLGADVPADRTLPDDAFGDPGTGVENVVVILLDGYGYDQWVRDYEDVPLLSSLSERGTVTPLTSIYPSETAAAMTTFYTGRYPVEHGLLGWSAYYEELGGILQPLPFTTQDGRPAEEVFPDATADLLFEGDPRYERLRAAGVTPTLSGPASNVEGPYGERTTAGADLEPYANAAGMAVSLRRVLEDGDGPQYACGYLPTVDGAAHYAGTESDSYRAQLEMTTECVRREVIDRLDPDVAAETLLVVTADHGHVDTGENVDLREGFDVVWENLRRDDDGDPIPPAGGSRNVHLFLQEGTVPAVRAAIEARLDCVTFTRDDAIARGLFGPADPGPTFRRRCGDLVVVHRNLGIWYEDGPLGHVGMHGGLTREEMLVPLASARVAELQ